MPQTHEVSDSCAVCGDTMVVTRLSCGHCGSALEGAFRLSASASVRRSGPTPARGTPEVRFGRLARLTAAQLEFVETFLRCRGVIKNVEDMLGISYPTVKARLNTVLEALGFAGLEEPPARDDRQPRGEIRADRAGGQTTIEEPPRLLQRPQGDREAGEAGATAADDNGEHE